MKRTHTPHSNMARRRRGGVRLNLADLWPRTVQPAVRVVGRGDQAAWRGAAVLAGGRVRRRTRPGSRAVALVLAWLLLAALVALWRAPTFRVQQVQVQGAVHLSPQLLERALGVTGRPAFLLSAERLERRLQMLFPNLKAVEVHIGWPAQVTLQVQERAPALVWQRGNGRLYIAADGVAWMPFPEEAPPAVQVTALGPLPPLAPDAARHDRVLPPATVRLAVQLQALKPQDAALIYDPVRGLGWRDPRGWDVFFGQQPDDLAARVHLAQQAVARLLQQGRRPALVDVSDLRAPFVSLER